MVWSKSETLESFIGELIACCTLYIFILFFFFSYFLNKGQKHRNVSPFILCHFQYSKARGRRSTYAHFFFLLNNYFLLLSNRASGGTEESMTVFFKKIIILLNAEFRSGQDQTIFLGRWWYWIEFLSYLF